VDGYVVRADDATVEAIEKFRAEQQKAFMPVSSSLLYLITSCELSKDAWDTLNNFGH
jgi:hypothetical protein